MAAYVDADSGRGGAPGPGLLTAVRRYPLVVVVLVLVGAALAAAATLALPTHFTAQAQVVLGDDNDATVYRNVQPVNAAARAQTAATAMRSHEVADRASALLDHRVSSGAVERSVTVAPSESAAMVTVSATRNRATSASDVANAVAKAYIELVKQQTQDQADRAQATLKRQQTDGIAKLDAVQRKQSSRAETIAARYASITVLSDRERLIQGDLNSDTAYQSLARQADRLSQTLADLRQTITENRVDTQLLTGGVDTVYPASTPKDQSASVLRRNLLIGGVLGLLVGVVVAWRRLDRRRGLEGDLVARALGAPMLGHVASTRELRRPTTVVDLTPGRALSDDLRVLASSVVLDLRHRGLGAALVTSTEAREGRTVLALNLAAAAQASGHDVVLVDGDVRHPDLTSDLGLADRPGLGDLLGGAGLPHLGSVSYGDDGALPVVPVGRPAASTGTGVPDLVRPDGSRPTAIVDCAALGEDPFALGLAASGWAGLVVVVSQVSTLEHLTTLRARADLVGSPVLGFVLNDHRAPRRRRRATTPDAARYRGRRRVESPADTMPADTARADTTPADTAPADTAPAGGSPAGGSTAVDTAPVTPPPAAVTTTSAATATPTPTPTVRSASGASAASPAPQ